MKPVLTLHDIFLMMRGAIRIFMCFVLDHKWNYHLIGDVRKQCSRCHEESEITEDDYKEIDKILG